jgi:hypothetical protein
MPPFGILYVSSYLRQHGNKPHFWHISEFEEHTFREVMRKLEYHDDKFVDLAALVFKEGY